MQNSDEKMPGDVNILIVDDDPFLRDLLVRYLSQQNYTVVAVKTGKEAVEKTHQMPFQIAVIDILLPEMSGIELVDELNAIKPEMILILITGHPTLETALEALKRGVQDYLVKPFRLEQLDKVLKKSLEEKVIISENTRLKAELEKTKEQIKKYETLIRHSRWISDQHGGEESPDYYRGDAAYRVQSLHTRETALQDRMNKLVLLKEEGVLTEDEFEVMRKRMISSREKGLSS